MIIFYFTSMLTLKCIGRNHEKVTVIIMVVVIDESGNTMAVMVDLFAFVLTSK